MLARDRSRRCHDARPDAARTCQHAAGPVQHALARHRRPRPRRLVAARLRRAHRPARRVPRRAVPVHDRHVDRPARRLLRRLGRHAHELARQRRRRVPVLRADHRARLRARLRARATSTSRSRSSAGCRTRASSAARCSSRSGASTCSRRSAGGLSDARILFRHLLPNVITQAIVFAMLRHRARHPRDRHARLSRARRAAADAGLGHG